MHQEWGNEISFYNGWGGAHLSINDVESVLATTLFAVYSVGLLDMWAGVVYRGCFTSGVSKRWPVRSWLGGLHR
jgi:hypothetical protein